MNTATCSVPTAASAARTTLAPVTQGAVNHPALSATQRGDHCGRRSYTAELNATLASLAAAFYTGGAAAVIAAASGSNNNYCRHAWALAMTVVHGPTGVHPSQTGHPRVIEVKTDALARLREYLAV